MKKIVFLIPLVIMVGCTDTKITGPNNSWNFHNNSFLWTRANVKGSISTNGVFSFSEDNSTPDQKSIETLTGAVVGLVGSIKP